jgi:hypothetical protein
LFSTTCFSRSVTTGAELPGGESEAADRIVCATVLTGAELLDGESFLDVSLFTKKISVGFFAFCANCAAGFRSDLVLATQIATPKPITSPAARASRGQNLINSCRMDTG